ncbi:DNA polymerase Y family protein, partial [Siccirubricoccus sp. KC 17139]
PPVPPGGEAAAIAPLPLAALRLPREAIATFHRLGLRHLGAVLRQPRAPLARRFGPAVMALLDAATGARPRPLQPLQPPPDCTVAEEFLEPLVTREAIDAALARLLPSLCARLEAAGLGARRLVLRAFRVDGAVQAIPVGTGLPGRAPWHFARLFQERLGRLEPGFGFDRLALEAHLAAPLAAAQGGLPSREGAAPDQRAAALAELLDRLAQRLPVWRLAPGASHWPEREVRRIGPFEALQIPPGWPSPGRPLRLLRRPVELSAMAVMPDAPPSLLRAGKLSWRVLRAEGPERITPEWWRDRPDRLFRDYYRVELTGGARLWVCRAGPAVPGEAIRWWLHGRFA